MPPVPSQTRPHLGPYGHRLLAALVFVSEKKKKKIEDQKPADD
jgi:hypothetical protein